MLDRCFKTTWQSPEGCRAAKGKAATAKGAVTAPPAAVANKWLCWLRQREPRSGWLAPRDVLSHSANPQRRRELMSAAPGCKVS